jgi:integrase
MQPTLTDSLVLSQAIPLFEKERLAAGYSPATMRSIRVTLGFLLTHSGDQALDAVTPKLVADFTGWRRKAGDADGTLNKRRYHLAAFFEWARANGYMPPASNPLSTTRAVKVMPSAKLRIPADEFPRLLDAAPTPKDRIIVALGLFLFLRGSEIAELRWQDVDYKSQEIHVTVPKTKQRDIMPISKELDYELRRWAVEYGRQAGIVRRENYIVPASVNHLNHEPLLVPGKPHPQAYRNVQRVLELAGYQVRGENGESLREGQHTLRRSGARALFDARLAEGYDGALRQVQAMLHHTTGAMTEKYLGLDIDRQVRNSAIKGKAMFAKNLPVQERENMKHLAVVS